MTRDRFFLLAGIGVVAWVIGFFLEPKTAMLAFLAGYAAVLFSVLGALFFVLLHHVVDAGWSTVARRWAEQIIECSPLSVRATKQCAMEGLEEPSVAAAMQRRYPALSDLFKSEDMKEGPLAFAQKRKPEWKGR